MWKNVCIICSVDAVCVLEGAGKMDRKEHLNFLYMPQFSLVFVPSSTFILLLKMLMQLKKWGIWLEEFLNWRNTELAYLKTLVQSLALHVLRWHSGISLSHAFTLSLSFSLSSETLYCCMK